MVASHRGYVEVVEALLSHNADIDLQDSVSAIHDSENLLAA